MLFDVGGDDALLPNSQAAPRWRPAAPKIALHAQELVRDHDGERFAIALGFAAILDCYGQLDRGLPQYVIFEEQAGAQPPSPRAPTGGDRPFRAVENETDAAAAETR